MLRDVWFEAVMIMRGLHEGISWDYNMDFAIEIEILGAKMGLDGDNLIEKWNFLSIFLWFLIFNENFDFFCIKNDQKLFKLIKIQKIH